LVEHRLEQQIHAIEDDVGEWTPEMLDEAENAAMAASHEIVAGSSEFITDDVVNKAVQGECRVPRWMTLPVGPARDSERRQFEKIQKAKAELEAKVAKNAEVSKPQFWEEALAGFLVTPTHEVLAYVWPSEVIVRISGPDDGASGIAIHHTETGKQIAFYDFQHIHAWMTGEALGSKAFGLTLLLKPTHKKPTSAWFLTEKAEAIIAKIRSVVAEILAGQTIKKAGGQTKGVSKEGFMRKQGEGVMGFKVMWNPRYFKLNKNSLGYWDEDISAMKNPPKPKGHILLTLGAKVVLTQTVEAITLDISQDNTLWSMKSMKKLGDAGGQLAAKNDLKQWKLAIDEVLATEKSKKAGTFEAVAKLGEKRAKLVSALFVVWDKQNKGYLVLEPVSVAMNLLTGGWGIALGNDIFLSVMKEAGVTQRKVEPAHLCHWMHVIFGDLSDEAFGNVVGELKAMDFESFI